MKRILSIVFIALIAVVNANAQSNLKKVYDETADPMEQISKAVQDAGKDGRFVIC